MTLGMFTRVIFAIFRDCGVALECMCLDVSNNASIVSYCYTVLIRHIIGHDPTSGLVYTTLSGTVGALVPFTVKEDVDFFLHLEMHLRGENPPLCGRDHLSYRYV